jgi:MYND finger
MDRETRALLRRARNALLEPIFEAMSSTSPNAFSLPTDSLKLQRIQVANRLISDMYRWADFHTESEQERWERYTEAFRLFSAPTERRLVRRLWKEQQKAQRAAASAQDTSRTMCSNCFVLRKAFLEECSECMLDCGRCRRVVYCSRECQVEHWKKGHKNQCRTVETL